MLTIAFLRGEAMFAAAFGVRLRSIFSNRGGDVVRTLAIVRTKPGRIDRGHSS